MKFSGDGTFELCFEHNCDLPLCLLALKTEEAQCTGCWMPFINAHVHKDDTSTAIRRQHCVTKLLKDYYQKENKQVSIKRFQKRNLADVGISQCMNALADKVHKQEVPCTQCNIATLFNNHPYISSSDTPVGTKFTATYVVE